MYKSILAILLVGLLAAPAMAVPPPGYNGDPEGWGNSPLQWDNHFGEATKCACWNPVDDVWNACPGSEPPFCIEMTVELWIELHAIMTVECLFHQFHSIGNNRDGDFFSFYIAGVTSSNNPLAICMLPGPDMDLGYLQFVEDVEGNDNGENDIPLNWAYAMGRGRQAPPPQEIQNWQRLYPDPFMCFVIPEVCDWWWYFWGWFWVVYHEDDGYYVLYFAICPVPVL